MTDSPDQTDKGAKAVSRETIRDVLNNYAHGATIKQCAESAGVDYDTADRIIADAIAEQNRRTSRTEE